MSPHARCRRGRVSRSRRPFPTDVARIELAPEVRDDLGRIFDISRHDVANAPARIREIIQAISVLETNPLIGWPARRHKVS